MSEDSKYPENIFGGSRWLTHGEQNHRQKLKEEVECLWQKAERSTAALLSAQTMQVWSVQNLQIGFYAATAIPAVAGKAVHSKLRLPLVAARWLFLIFVCCCVSMVLSACCHSFTGRWPCSTMVGTDLFHGKWFEVDSTSLRGAADPSLKKTCSCWTENTAEFWSLSDLSVDGCLHAGMQASSTPGF